MYLLLQDFGCEGWVITEFNTTEELEERIKDGCSQPIKIAKELKIRAVDEYTAKNSE